MRPSQFAGSADRHEPDSIKQVVEWPAAAQLNAPEEREMPDFTCSFYGSPPKHSRIFGSTP
jgi:hypothetical protein